MPKIKFMINNEKGSAIVAAIMVLVLLSLIGVESSTTSTMEVQIAASGRDAKKAFYLAEGAAMEAAQGIENAESEDLVDRLQKWLHKDSDINLADESQWTADKTEETSLSGSETRFGVMDKGVATGGSLHMGHASQLHTFRVFGRSGGEKQRAFIEMGYRRRY